MIIGDNITTILDGALPNVTNITTSTKVQEYSYFSFDITNPERDVAFVVTIHDGMATLHCTVAFAWLFVVCCLLIDVLLIDVFVVCLLVLLVACLKARTWIFLPVKKLSIQARIPLAEFGRPTKSTM